MPSVKDEIRAAIEKLKLSPNVFRELPDDQGESVYRRALRHFVAEGEPRWWWEHFKSASVLNFPTGDGWRHISQLVPDPSELVWLIAEDDSLPFYPVYDTTPSQIGAVIAECYGFEYYIVARNFQWLLCEDHHNRIFGIGTVVEDKLRNFTSLEKGANFAHGDEPALTAQRPPFCPLM